MNPQEKKQHLKSHPKIRSKNLDDEEALFIKKLEKGTGKYKGKLPLNFFNCGRIRYFASKCPYPKQNDNHERETSKLKKRIKLETLRNPMKKR